MSDDLGRGSSRGLGTMVLRSSAWLMGARLGRILITLVGTAILSRLLTPDDFGLFFFAITAIVLVTVILEGFVDLPITREDTVSPDGVRTLVWASFALVGTASLCLWLAAPYLERWLGFSHLSATLRGIVPSFVAQVPFMVGTALLRRQHRFGLVAAVQVANVALYTALACALVAVGYGYASLLIALNVAQVTTAVAVAIAARAPIGWPARWIYPSGVADGGIGALSRFIAWLWTNVDTFVVSALFGPAVTGLYSRAYNLNVQAKEPFAAIDQPIRQAFAAMKDRGGGLVAPAVLALRLLTLLSGLVAAAMIVLRDQIVLVLLGGQWLAATVPFAILAASLPARVALLYIDSVTITAGSMGALLGRNIAILALVSLGLAAVATNGVAYVAAVVATTLYLSLVLAALAFRPGSGLNPGHIARAIAPGMVLGAALCVAGFGIERLQLSLIMDGGAKAGMMGCAAMMTILATPKRWLPPRFILWRARLWPGEVKP